MQVSTDLLIWKTQHVAVFTGRFVKSNFPNVFLRCSSTLVTKFGISLTPASNRFIASSSSFDYNRSPDARSLGLWDSLRPYDDEALCCLSFLRAAITFQISRFWFRDFWMPGGTCEMQSVTRCLAWILLACVIGLLNHSRLVSRCLT